jgi:hypothetical protein
MASYDAGLTSLGVLIGWAIESTAGQKPTNTGTSTSGEAFSQVLRVNSIGGVSVDPEQIDVSAIVDKLTRYKPGRGDSGGTFTIGVNVTQDVITQWKDIITTYYSSTSRQAGLRMWWQVTHPDLTDAFFIVAAPPEVFPMPETGQNEAWTVEINLVVDELKGLDTKVPFTQVDGVSNDAA